MSDTIQIDIRRKQIEFLVETYYNKFDFLHNESLDILKEKALDRFLNSDLTIDEINEMLMQIIQIRIKALEDRYDKDKVKENHKTIYYELELLIDALNKEDIDYHLAGALCGYLKYGQESERCHDDIDIHLNEKDIDRFGRICEELGFSFQDNRLQSPRVLKNGIPIGEHEVIANKTDNSLHIGAFCFERLADGTVITKGYYHDDKQKPCCREEIIGSTLAKEIFGKDEAVFHGRKVHITSPEYIYLLKKYTNSEKDQTDIKFLEPRIDKEKVARIRSLEKDEKYVQCVPVFDLPTTHKINVNAIENDNSEISQMLVESKEKVEKTENSLSNEKPKQLVRTDKNGSNQGGFSVLFTIALTILIVIGLILIGLIVITLLRK